MNNTEYKFWGHVDNGLAMMWDIFFFIIGSPIILPAFILGWLRHRLASHPD